MRQVLKKHFGYDQFLPKQEEIIQTVLEKRDALVLMPTGGGKSLCYQLPALMLPGVTLVISPLIALMKDQVDALRANGIQAAFINSTLESSEIETIQKLTQSGGVKLLYIAPERLATSSFSNFLRTLAVSLIAVDEAHCISEWGHDFRPDYRNLRHLRKLFSSVPMLALTATATEKVREDIRQQLSLHEAPLFLLSFNRKNLTYHIQPKRQAFSKLLQLLTKYKNEPTIIYCFSRKDTENLASDLKQEGYHVQPYHAGLNAETRTRTQDLFIRDEISIVVATIAFGMGIDKPDVRLVVHYDLPKSLEGYYQETGRAGRDGLPSECVLFYSYGDKMKHEFFISQIGDREEQLKARKKLEEMIRFCEAQLCRRKFLLEYFGETLAEGTCQGCDICLVPREMFDATEVTQKILSAVLRVGERFGASHIAGILRGSNNRKILNRNHDSLSVYGIVKDFSGGELKELTRMLVSRGFLESETGSYPTLSLTAKGKGWLRKGETIMLQRVKQEESPVDARRETSVKYNQELFHELRQLRKTLADQKKVPPYVIFSDRSLQEMAYYFPQSRQNFSSVFGVGKEKLAHYADTFLSVIIAFCTARGIAEHDFPREKYKDDTNRSVRRAGSTYDETRQLVAQKIPLAEIARKRGLAVGTILDHIERLVAVEKLDIAFLRPPAERFAIIKRAFEQSGDLALAPARRILGEDFSYDELQLVRLFMKS